MTVTPSFWSGKRVFLTGHTGFKGSWLTLWLSSMGAKVQGFALAPDQSPALFTVAGLDKDCASEIGDIRDYEKLKVSIHGFKPDVIIHMAAQPLVLRSYAEPLETFSTNVQGTAHVLEAARGLNSLAAILVVTTDKCYLNREWEFPYRENEALGGHDPYSASKAAAEIVTASYRYSFFNKAGPALASARAGNVIGGGDWSDNRLIPDAARAFSKGEPLVIRRPLSVRPWQHVVAPLAGYLGLCEKLAGANGHSFADAFNFGPHPIDAAPVREVISLFATAWGKDAKVEEVIDPNAPHEAGLLMLDPTKAAANFGWSLDMPLGDQIDATAEWYQAYYANPGNTAALRSLMLEQIKNIGEACYARTRHGSDRVHRNEALRRAS